MITVVGISQANFLVIVPSFLRFIVKAVGPFTLVAANPLTAS
jgi:hypothetical protein